MEKKKTVRSHKAQLQALLQYMAEHPTFAAGEYTATMGAQHHESQWLKLKAILDELGPSRSVVQWKTCWRDQKRKARAEGGAHRRAINKTGNGPVPELSENAALILQTIGAEMAEGIGDDEPPLRSTGTGQEQQQEPIAGSSSASAPLAGSSSAAKPSSQRRKRTLPSDRFLKEQMKNNEMLQQIVQALQSITKELAESNRLKRMKLQGHGDHTY